MDLGFHRIHFIMSVAEKERLSSFFGDVDA